MTPADPALQSAELPHVLQSERQLETAIAAARAAGLCPSPVRSKHWDNLKAVRLIEEVAPDRGAPIADLGCRGGILLTWLWQRGFRDLSGCDLRLPVPPLRGAASAGQWSTVLAGLRMYIASRRTMVRAPVERTTLPGARFRVVTCMSVIEHGVDVGAFLKEAARLLVPGGTLIVSTDYWPTPIPTGGLKRFSETWGTDVIFDSDEMVALCRQAEAAGFASLTPLELSVTTPVVRGSGLAYTFIFLAFRKIAATASAERPGSTPD